MEYALGRLETFKLPKLINVQTLALLSIAAKPYFEPHVSNRVFEQACLLARRMGLGIASREEGLSTDAVEERSKVLRSLYLQDKPISLNRGTNCLLPSFDCDLHISLQESSHGETQLCARYQLSRCLEDIYIRLYSNHSHQQSASQRNKDIGVLDSSLLAWARTYGQSLDSYLLMEYIEARIAVLRQSGEDGHQTEVKQLSRISCTLLAPTATIAQRTPLFDSSGALASSLAVTQPANLQVPPGANHSEPPFRIRSLVEKFPMSAFFTLARSIISQNCEEYVVEDLELIRMVNRTFQDYFPHVQVKTVYKSSEQAVSNVLRLIRIVRPELFPEDDTSAALTANESPGFEANSSTILSSFSNTSGCSNGLSPSAIERLSWLDNCDSLMFNDGFDRSCIYTDLDISGDFNMPLLEMGSQAVSPDPYHADGYVV
ncbi:hypothetical protein ONS95_005120 [Cadophora gregata]|uniref:uncharacterized protein n=1 Tax=Cadophora gregata TaxID=51156 RepID=UPI0026DC92B1|nr:uncharacterized protein ONS95_005120 [Cadophora gregata]KAK0104854.1 hypothetical protein ONS95_005120 [Cadophora gregata]